jgi:hypothetical protein
MHFSSWLNAALSVGLGAALVSCETFANRVIFTPTYGSRVSYPRVTELSDGTILATVGWRDPNATRPYFPVFESKDGGASWKHISNLTDQVRDQCRSINKLNVGI